MKKVLLSVTVSLLAITTAFAQANKKHVMFGIGGGTLHYSGDIATDITVNSLLKETGTNGLFSMKIYLNEHFTLGGELSRGTIYASDENHRFSDRGLDLTCNVNQGNGYVEWTFARFFKRRGMNGNGVIEEQKTTSLYLKAGAGLIYWSPNLTVNDPAVLSGITVYNDRYLGGNYLIGGGLAYQINRKSSLVIDVSGHYVLTDRLDGFQFKNNNTAYDYYAGLSVRYYYAILK